MSENFDPAPIDDVPEPVAQEAPVVATDSVVLFVEDWLQGTFYSNVQDVEPITQSGTVVSANLVDAVLEAAQRSNVAIGRK
jgi:hypothetical protein